MPNLPQIKVEISPDLDAKAFINFLWHPFLKQNRQMIIKIYPEIEGMIGSNSAKEDIKKFVLSLHQQKKEQLENIKDSQEKIITEKGQDAFQRLGEIMNYAWENPFIYTAYLSLLPFSPFKEDHFLYSVLGQLNDDTSKNKSVLVVAVHEISHVIFLNLLKKLRIQSSEGTKHLFKEALTAAILRDVKLSAFLNYKHADVNPEIRELYVKRGDRVLRATDYLFGLLIENVDLNKNFLEQVKELLEEFKKSDKSFGEKMDFWNKHGKSIFKDGGLLKKYQEPIPLN
jgi:hypothetical protein